MTLPLTSKTDKTPRGSRTICLPFDEHLYPKIVANPAAFRAALDAQYRQTPELFPPAVTKDRS